MFNDDKINGYNAMNAQDPPAQKAESSEDPLSPQKEPRKSRKRSAIGYVLVGVVCLLVGVGIGVSSAAIRGMLQNGTAGVQSDNDSSGSAQTSDESGDYVSAATLDDVLDAQTVQKLQTVLSLIDEGYYENFSLDAVREGVVDGLVAGIGDKYTDYYTVDEYTELTMQTSGSYEGIGAVLSKNAETSEVSVKYLYNESPAKEAGVEVGDVITAVDGKAVKASDDASDVATAVRGEAGTTVTLTVERDEESLEFEIERREIDMESVLYEMIDKSSGVGYIEVVSFSKNTEEQFAAALDDLNGQGMKSLIIDLRDNGGGVVTVCAQMLDDLLPGGTVVYTMDKNGNRTDYTSEDSTQLDIPMVVLVNGNSASASEIFTAAMKDYEWATIIGTTTYGKGVYQSIYSLNDGSGLKITVGKFYSPLGNNFDQTGIEPDIELEYENTGGEDAPYSAQTDNQLQKAIEYLNNND